MGAILNGYFLFVPEKLKSQEKKKLQDHIKKIKKILTTDKYDDEEINRRLEELNVQVYGYCEDSDEKVYQQIDKDLLTILEFIKNPFDNLDSMASTNIEVKKRDIRVMFAGGMTWGDDPDSSGYRLLNTLWRIGIGDLLYEICFSS